MKKLVRIVFPEGQDKRILKAATIIARKKIAIPVIVNGRAKGCQTFYFKGDEIDYAMNLVKSGIVDGCICGAMHSTLKTIRSALHIIKSKFASSYFFLPEKKIFFADCALNINPDSEQLAQIAEQTAASAKMLGIKPRVAFLSYSTKGSGKGESVDKVRKAAEIFRKRNKNIAADGELQIDAAIVPQVAQLKGSRIIKGDANIFIFPNLDAGNIGYKIAQRFGNLKALGPVLQGLKKPVSDLSRGCSVDEIVEVAKLIARQAQRK